jgi:hypothetical protein
MRSYAVIILYWLIAYFPPTVGSSPAYAQGSGGFAFAPGEKITLEVSYNWGPIWISAGEIVFEAGLEKDNGEDCFRFLGRVKSYKFYDHFYRVRDRFESRADAQTLQSSEYNGRSEEGGNIETSMYLFDPHAGTVQTFIKNAEKPLVKRTFSMKNAVYDPLTAVYVTRNLDFNGYRAGESITIPIILDGQWYELVIKYYGRENLKNRDGKRYRCFKFGTVLQEGTIFEGGKEITVWVTDDGNKIPIMAEARILIGAIRINLAGQQGLKHEMTSLITD